MRAWMVAALVGALGCGGDDPRVERARETCYDTAEEFAMMLDRCYPGTYQQAYDELAMDCPDVRGIRDEAELRDVCFVWMRVIECDVLDARLMMDLGPHESCLDQIRY